MTTVANRVTSLLDRQGVAYRVVHHRQDFTAQKTAQDTNTPGWEFAKAVIVSADGDDVMVVLPAPRHVDLAKVKEALGARKAHLVEEHRIRLLFPDCELGAEPPFGNLYNMPVYVSPELSNDEYITFNAGTHMEAIRMRYDDFAELVHPVAADLAA
jgi:Ala-tRNA(Pro) deacylase